MEEKDSVCVWKEVPVSIWATDGFFWDTACGVEWDGPARRFGFCPFCGRRINVLREPKGGKK